MAPGDTWFGSPAIKLPTRQKVDIGANWTYEPSSLKKIWRARVRGAAHLVPVDAVHHLRDPVDRQLLLSGDADARLAACWPRASSRRASSSRSLQTCIVVAVKWLTMGVYTPIMKPMWSWWAMRTEAVAVLYWGLGGKVLLEHLQGTPFLPWFLRLFGARMGKGICMNTTDITEFDCVDGRRFLHRSTRSPPCRRISTRTAS